MKEIKIQDFSEISIGQVESIDDFTGVTAIISREGMNAGLHVSGGGPALRESGLLDPMTNDNPIHAVVFSGGSAYGLNAGGGVMDCLLENGIGYDVLVTKVPLVCQADLFDIGVSGKIGKRPDSRMGYEAAKKALEGGNYRDGNHGAGMGATVGKMKGRDFMMKSGIGSHAVRIGDVKIGAVSVVNALGDIYDPDTGKKTAGALNDDLTGFEDTFSMIERSLEPVKNKFTGNTTLSTVVTNAEFTKTELCKMSRILNNAYARCIYPVNTSADGDSIFSLSVGDVKADLDMVSSVAVKVLEKAILKAVSSAEEIYGIKSVNSL